MLRNTFSSTNHKSHQTFSLCFALEFLVCIALASGTCLASTPSPGDLVSSVPFQAPDAIRGQATLLIYYMPSVQGGMTKASTLLFVPQGRPPLGGWPVIAWAHGTTTPGQKTCAPSLSRNLDGGLTTDGWTSDYVFLTASLVRSGYAVVSPDFEGLGTIASVPLPYYNAASLARSLIDAVRAARHADPHLSSNWVAVGHSDGGHAVLGVEAFAAEAPELNFKGAVAYAPYTSIAASVSAASNLTTSDSTKTRASLVGQNFNVALMAAGLQAQSPAFDVGSVMGNDLRQQMATFKSRCSVPALTGLTQAVAAKATSTFSGFRAQWSTVPEMASFLSTNDPAVEPGFNLRLSTLIVQGTADPFVPEAFTASFAQRLIAAGDPVSYREYMGADHFTLIKAATPDVLTFLAKQFEESTQ